MTIKPNVGFEKEDLLKRKVLLVAGLALLLSLVLVACGTQSGGGQDGGGDQGGETNYKKSMQLGTGSTGGTYFPLGGEMATLLSDQVNIDGFNVSSVESGASVENMAKIGRGQFQLGMTINGTAANALNGEGQFQDGAINNAGFMLHIYPEVLHAITRESTSITSIDQLEGKRVAIGPPGSGTQAAAKVALSAYGLEEGDYQAFEEGFGDAAGKLQDGNIDASFAILGSPAASVNQLQASTGDVRYLEITGDALNNVQEQSFYGPFKIPNDAYDWTQSEINTISAYAVLMGSTTQVSPEAGYQITKTLLEQHGEISHPQAASMTKEKALKGRQGMPLHPGSKRYYEEQGMLEE